MPKMRKEKTEKKALSVPPLNMGVLVRSLRQERGLSGVEFCRRSRGIDPKTLTALEKGRIRNPSMVTLEALARGFDLSVSDLFRKAEIDQRDHFFQGSPKGFCKIDLASRGIQLISFTPLQEGLFCGKMILEGQKRFDETLFGRTGNGAFFVMTLIGHFEGEVEGQKVVLREGDNLYFYGGMRFSLTNVLQRNSTLLVASAPSCLNMC